ncbi:NAD(P)/FAD-dependent oxidoreductase [Roseospira marina]|uniref:Ferredoxin--NADP reductase n=1 Tax=Roseospira marina TaxID=140057 RepID=A0A5M6IHL6_9PROT|nr:NAD(P)/FAD-dependent oxidoreductase [Roseospira marina]KAA5607125.1 NAD(P)/FAD-dependent oxidoreductase [Roseospira marina]MBB4312676.1 thioredoxin reductase (NADPH) [Roseospira marina]MBB5086551.1 thioredoxin reductase (NADPH) [Roseospira marina]
MPESAVHRTDAVIIGAGPVGLFTVFQLGMSRIRSHVVDVLDAPGGQLTALYPEKPIYDIPAYPKVLAGDLVDHLMTQAAPFDPTFHLGQRVEGLERTADDTAWRLTTSAGVVLEAPAVIIAAGGGAFGPNRPPLPGIEAYEGSSVFYMVAKRAAFRDRRVVIAGGGDSAVDWAISLAEVAADVKVVHRRAKFRAAPDSVAQLHAMADSGRIELVVPYQLHGLEGEGGELSAVIVADLDGATRRLEADRLLPFFGLATNLGPLAEWNLTLDHQRIVVDPATCQTTLPGVFAVGDVASYPGKLKLILTGFAEASMAAHAAYAVVHPGQALHFEHSTTTGVPALA